MANSILSKHPEILDALREQALAQTEDEDWSSLLPQYLVEAC